MSIETLQSLFDEPHGQPPFAPKPEELAAAKAKFTEKYGKEVDAVQTDLDKFTMLGKLRSSGDEQTLKYVCYLREKELALQWGEIWAGMLAINDLEVWYGVEYWQNALDFMSASSKAPKFKEEGFRCALCYTYNAIKHQQFDYAEKALQIAESIAKATQKKEQLDSVAVATARLEDSKTHFFRAEAALDNLANGIRDRKGMFEIGEYLYLYQRKVSPGLLMLSVTADGTFKLVVDKELALENSQTKEPLLYMQTADAISNYAKTQRGMRKTLLLIRAVELYQMVRFAPDEKEKTENLREKMMPLYETLPAYDMMNIHR